MELVLKPNTTAGFEPNDRGEPLDLYEPVAVVNLHLHIKHNNIFSRVILFTETSLSIPVYYAITLQYISWNWF